MINEEMTFGRNRDSKNSEQLAIWLLLLYEIQYTNQSNFSCWMHFTQTHTRRLNITKPIFIFHKTNVRDITPGRLHFHKISKKKYIFESMKPDITITYFHSCPDADFCETFTENQIWWTISEIVGWSTTAWGIGLSCYRVVVQKFPENGRKRLKKD